VKLCDLPVAVRAKIDLAILDRRLSARRLFEAFRLESAGVAFGHFQRHTSALRRWAALQDERQGEIISGEQAEQLIAAVFTTAGRAAVRQFIDPIIVELLRLREMLGEGGCE
jgi:hypothetical protein